MIRLENLTKLYGSFVAVDDISLHVPRGVLYGCLGPNGAGKTTTLRMIAGILRPTQGRVLLGGDDVHANPLSAKMRLGFIPDRPFVYDKLTGAEFLRFVAGLYGQEGDVVERRIAELLEVFELTSWKDELVEAYSHGMRQKLIISSALIHRPECIVVDEPMVGLDPKAVDEHAHARSRRSDVRPDRDHPARQDRRGGNGQRRAPPAQSRRRQSRGAVPQADGRRASP